MMQDWKKRTLICGTAVLLLTAGAAVEKTMAYFTTYAGAQGSAPVSLGFTRTEIGEEVKNQAKYITVLNTGACDAFVRVRLYAGAGYEDGLVFRPAESAGWEQRADGFYYYTEVLPAGSETGSLCVGVDWKDQEGGFNTDREDFRVIVVQESTGVFYDEDKAPTCSWEDEVGITEVLR